MSRFATRIWRSERRELAAALGACFLVMVAHALLETARDALFLTHVPATHLPWLYLAIAALAVAVGPLLARPRREATNRRILLCMQLVAAGGTAAFLPLIAAPRGATYYALYLWGGIAAAVILTRFWLILGDRFTATQAKRLFPLIAAGAVGGSLVGFAAAGLLATRFAPTALLAASAAAFLASAAVTGLWWRVRAPVERPEAKPNAMPVESAAPQPWSSLGLVARHPYVRRLALTLLLASVAVTLCDFLFKSAVVQAVSAPRLATFLAAAYLVFDLAALALLLFAVTPFVRVVGVPNALLARPIALLAGGVAVALLGGLPAALALRGADGALRWSLHKTVCELLYVPMTPPLRAAVKEVSDLAAHRGGQALGSLLILALLAAGQPWGAAAWPLIAAAGAWLVLGRALRGPYRTLCRDTLGDAVIETRLAFPELDMASLERLLRELNDPDDARVLAALDLLGATGRTHVVPALILYHPSAAVVGRALELFRGARRADWLPLAARVLRHPDAGVRASAVHAFAGVNGDAEALRRLTTADCAIVSAIALIGAAAGRLLTPEAAVEGVRARLDAADDAERATLARCVARALRDLPLPAFGALLAELSAAPDAAAAREAVHALGALRAPRDLPLLLGLLPRRALRDAVRRALLGYGAPALAALAAALRDPTLPYAVRVHVPRAISRFGHQAAADVLLAHLHAEPGGMVAYKILRGLGRLRADLPSLHLDRAQFDALVEAHLTKAFTLAHWIAVLDARPDAAPRSVAHALLVDLLRQKRTFAIERLFRALGLRDASADFAQLYDGVRSPDAATRATSQELLEQLLPAPWRAALRALTSEAHGEADGDPLRAAPPFYVPPAFDDAGLVATLVDHPDDAVAALASQVAAERGLALAEAAAPRRAAAAGDRLAELRTSALARARADRPQPAAAATGSGG